jgi:hypothetical protein
MNMSDDKVINIQKFQPKQTHEFTKEEMPFTLVCNKVINECQNPIAGFIWIYLQSKAPTWKPCKWEIMKRFDISERTYQRHMSYLSSTHLIENIVTRDKNGKVVEWRIKVLNGSRFNPKADSFKGIAYAVHVNHTAKNGVVDKPAPDKDSSHTAKCGEVDSSHTAKKPHSGEMARYINTRSTSLEKKEKDPPLSPKGEKKELFSLRQMLEDNPHQIPESMISDWLEVRKSKRAKMTPTAWKGTNSVLEKLTNFGLSPVECFESMVASGWQGIKVSYFEKEIAALKPKAPLKYVTKEDRAAEYEKIAARERAAEQRKQEEREAAKGFKDIVKEAKEHVSFKERLRLYELDQERIKNELQ